jgi:hypothetical protein
MLLEFKVYQLKEGTRTYDSFVKISNKPNDFIIVGEEKLSKDYDCYKVQQVYENGICMLGGLMIDEAALLVKKDELELKGDIGYETQEFDIPKKYLTMDIIENIKRLNA